MLDTGYGFRDGRSVSGMSVQAQAASTQLTTKPERCDA